MKGIRVRKEGLLQGEVVLEGSKSLSNRILLLEALSGRRDFTLPHLSPSEDTRIMRDLLLSSAPVLDAGDCGTAFRFMTAWLAWKGEARMLTGSARMLQRPVGPLVEALRNLGFQIKYLGEVGFPPLQFGGVASAKVAGASDGAGSSLGSVAPLGRDAPLGWDAPLEIRADVSSQFVSALCLLGPVLPGGLDLALKGKLSSTPYIEMTLGLLEGYGILTSFDKESKRIRVWPGSLVPPANPILESDWSAAAFYFAMMAHAAVGSELVLKGLEPCESSG
jgi:3-phosphoshikimate 1-carboxyvinyltransferase